jgi:DNA invertase Pin-like site-specific DNA recombinase
MTATNSRPKHLDAYIRVSRVNGREGDGYISPGEQRKRIEEWAAREGVEIVQWWEELDQSGGKLDRPMIQAALERCRKGETDGIVVAKRDRFARTLIGALQTIQELEEMGAVFAAADGLDSSTPEGKFAVNLMLSMADFELRRIRDGWRAATENAVADGIHISARPPTGYLRENGKRSRLVPDPEIAPLIHEVFFRRAKGESWGALATYLQENGVPSSKTGVTGIVRNRAYLGEARGSHGAVNLSAHEPLVTVEEWEAAQWKGRTYAKDGTVAARGMLSGLITCVGCGHKLSVTMSRYPKTGENRPIYFCKGQHSGGRCPERPAAEAERIDQFVRDAFAAALFDGTLATTMDAVARYRNAESAVAKAQADLDALADPRFLDGFGAEGFAGIVEKQRAVLDEAKRMLRETPKPGEAVQPTMDLFGPEWPIDRERQFAKQYIAEITLARGGKGRWSRPVGQRLAITWAGHDEPDATLYERVEKMRDELPALVA